MNDRLLVYKRINFPKEHINFLNFIHPNFEIVTELNGDYNPYSSGIIYIGQYENNTLDILGKVKKPWIVVNAHHFDLDLTTNEGLIKNLLPIYYAQLKNSKKDNSSVYTNISYDSFIEKIKASLICNLPILCDESDDMSVYNLYQSILGTPDVLNAVFFTTVNKSNVSLVTSSILTFLNRVQSQNTRGTSIYYSRLIIQSNLRYGKRIKQAICRFVKSKSNKEVSLYNLLVDLNRSR